MSGLIRFGVGALGGWGCVLGDSHLTPVSSFPGSSGRVPQWARMESLRQWLGEVRADKLQA